MENISDDPHNTGGLDIGTPENEITETSAGTAAAPALEPEPQDEPEA